MAPITNKNKIPAMMNTTDIVPSVERLVLGTIAQTLKNKKNKQKQKPTPPALTIGGQTFSKANLGVGRGNLSSGPLGTQMIVEKTEAWFTVKSSQTSGLFRSQEAYFHAMASALNWLPNMANAFTSYEVLRLEFTYVPAVPTTTGGAVSLAFLEDARDDTPSSMAQMLATEQSLYAPVYAGGEGGTFLQRFGSPSGNVISFEIPRHAICGADGTPKRFKVTRPANLDLALSGGIAGIYSVANYTPGKLVVSTEGITATDATMGQLFVRYKIRLSGSIAISNQA